MSNPDKFDLIRDLLDAIERNHILSRLIDLWRDGGAKSGLWLAHCHGYNQDQAFNIIDRLRKAKRVSANMRWEARYYAREVEGHTVRGKAALGRQIAEAAGIRNAC